MVEKSVVVQLVDADTALHGDRHADRLAHCDQAIADELGLRHQARAEIAFLHSVAGATDVQVDFHVAVLLTEPCGLREQRRIGPADLQRDR